MKVRITASGLPVPVGTIMEVGDSPPAAWRGKCEPLIVTQADIMDEIISDSADLIDIEATPFSANPFRSARTSRKRDPG